MGNIAALGNTVVQTTPVGVIEAFAGVNAPAGWLFCDGSAVSRIQYPELFSALSTTYGSGDGSTTFNLPDMRGRMPVGKGTHADVSTLGNNEGASLANRRPKHQHTVYDPSHSHQQYLGWSGSGNVLPYWDGNTSRGIYGGGNGGPTSTGIKINPEGASSSTSPQDAPPYLVVNYIIKAVADLPRAGWTFQQNAPVVTQLPSNPAIGDEVYHLISSNIYHKRWDGSSWQSVANDLIDNQITFSKISNNQTNWAQNVPTYATVTSGSWTTIASVSFTCRGKGPILLVASGDANSYGGTGAAWNRVALFINNAIIYPYVIVQCAGESINNPWALTRILSNYAAGTYTIEVKAQQGAGLIQYGEESSNQSPSLVVVELI